MFLHLKEPEKSVWLLTELADKVQVIVKIMLNFTI